MTNLFRRRGRTVTLRHTIPLAIEVFEVFGVSQA
jgi:hypothetical protein